MGGGEVVTGKNVRLAAKKEEGKEGAKHPAPAGTRPLRMKFPGTVLPKKRDVPTADGPGRGGNKKRRGPFFHGIVLAQGLRRMLASGTSRKPEEKVRKGTDREWRGKENGRARQRVGGGSEIHRGSDRG